MIWLWLSYYGAVNKELKTHTHTHDRLTNYQLHAIDVFIDHFSILGTDKCVDKCALKQKFRWGLATNALRFCFLNDFWRKYCRYPESDN